MQEKPTLFIMSPNRFPTLQSHDYILREIIPEDRAHIFKGLSDPDVVKYYGVQYDTIEATQAQMDFFQALWDKQTGIWWAINTRENLSFCGAIGLNNLQKQHRKAEFGCWLLKEHWGKGILQKTIPLVCQYAFDNLKLHRLEAWVESENIACKKRLESLGFQHEGTLTDCEIKFGRFISLSMYALLQPHWNHISRFP